jgi:hypothetical protein
MQQSSVSSQSVLDEMKMWTMVGGWLFIISCLLFLDLVWYVLTKEVSAVGLGFHENDVYHNLMNKTSVKKVFFSGFIMMLALRSHGFLKVPKNNIMHHVIR